MENTIEVVIEKISYILKGSDLRIRDNHGNTDWSHTKEEVQSVLNNIKKVLNEVVIVPEKEMDLQKLSDGTRGSIVREGASWVKSNN